MKTSLPVRVFIGSGEASLLERKTLIHSLQKNCSRDLDIYVFNGTHNSVERNDEPPVLAPMPLEIKYRNVTEFSNYRFLIPQICNYEGRAIFLDSDMICLGDIAELIDTPMGEYDFLAKAGGYKDSQSWALSVMLIDCQRARFDLEQYFAEIDAGRYSTTDLHQMLPAFLACHPFKVGPLDPNWNVFDRLSSETKLIHYTNLFTQPWKAVGHPYGGLWHETFREALAAGVVTERDVELSRMRSYVRQDVMKGNGVSLRMLRKQMKHRFDRYVRGKAA